MAIAPVIVTIFCPSIFLYLIHSDLYRRLRDTLFCFEACRYVSIYASREVIPGLNERLGFENKTMRRLFLHLLWLGVNCTLLAFLLYLHNIADTELRFSQGDMFDIYPTFVDWYLLCNIG